MTIDETSLDDGKPFFVRPQTGCSATLDQERVNVCFNPCSETRKCKRHITLIIAITTE